MAEKHGNVSLKIQLEEAKRQGREEGLKEGRKEGMAALFALLSAAGKLEDHLYKHKYQEDDKYFQALLNVAMLRAAKRNQTDLVVFLLEAGADVNTENYDNHRTALSCAVKRGHTEVVQALLKAGARVYRSSDDHEPALAHAVANGYVEIVKALLAAGADIHDDYIPGQGGWLDVYTGEGDQAEITGALLDAGISIAPYDDLWTPLMSAAYHGKAKSAALLIEAGCNVNAQDDCGNTALMMAAGGWTGGDLDTIRLLLTSGAEPKYKNEDGETALICAARAGHSEAVRLLLSAGADVFSRANVPLTAEHDSVKKIMNAFDVATDDAVKEIIKSEMHRRIAAALSVLPSMALELRQKIIQLYIEQ